MGMDFLTGESTFFIYPQMLVAWVLVLVGMALPCLFRPASLRFGPRIPPGLTKHPSPPPPSSSSSLSSPSSLSPCLSLSYLTLQPASSPMSHRTIHIACSKVLFNAITIRVPDLCHFSDYVSNRLNPFSLHTDYLIGKICHSFIYFQLCSNLVFQLN